MDFCVVKCKVAYMGINNTIMSSVVNFSIRMRPWDYTASSMKASALYFTAAKKKLKSNVKMIENMVMPLCKSVDCLYVDYCVPFWSLHLYRNILVLEKVERDSSNDQRCGSDRRDMQS